MSLVCVIGNNVCHHQHRLCVSHMGVHIGEFNAENICMHSYHCHSIIMHKLKMLQVFIILICRKCLSMYVTELHWECSETLLSSMNALQKLIHSRQYASYFDLREHTRKETSEESPVARMCSPKKQWTGKLLETQLFSALVERAQRSSVRVAR